MAQPRQLLLALAAALLLALPLLSAAPMPGGTLDPLTIPKYKTKLYVPPVMAVDKQISDGHGKKADFYRISSRQIEQQVLPDGMPKTTVWGYGSAKLGNHHWPAPTIVATRGTAARVKWSNELVDENNEFLPELTPVATNLHWANPTGEAPDMHGDGAPYTGPVPTVVHVHGHDGVGDESDGYPEAWFLPDADNLDPAWFKTGTWYDTFAQNAKEAYGSTWGPGYATFQYPNSQPATTLWYHDHALGATRQHVYNGLAGYYLINDAPGAKDVPMDCRGAARKAKACYRRAKLPSGKYEVPLLIQDRSFNDDGSLFYQATSAWAAEFFGNVMTVNGNSWPVLPAKARWYRFRALNGCDTRWLTLSLRTSLELDAPKLKMWVIGTDSGYRNKYAAVVDSFDMGPAERFDLLVDLSGYEGQSLYLVNDAPDGSFGLEKLSPPLAGPADPDTTRQVLRIDVGKKVYDGTTKPSDILLPAWSIPEPLLTRKLAVFAPTRTDPANSASPIKFIDLGQVPPAQGANSANWVHESWTDPITFSSTPGSVEIWEFYSSARLNHPMHIHSAFFEVLNRSPNVTTPEVIEPPAVWERGARKDTVDVPAFGITRVKVQFADVEGLFVWHCHVLSHEDNEMMRPMCLGQPGYDNSHPEQPNKLMCPTPAEY